MRLLIRVRTSRFMPSCEDGLGTKSVAFRCARLLNASAAGREDHRHAGMVLGQPSHQSQPFAFDSHVKSADRDIHAIGEGHDPARIIAIDGVEQVKTVCAKMIAEHHLQDEAIFRHKLGG